MFPTKGVRCINALPFSSALFHSFSLLASSIDSYPSHYRFVTPSICFIPLSFPSYLSVFHCSTFSCSYWSSKKSAQIILTSYFILLNEGIITYICYIYFWTSLNIIRCHYIIYHSIYSQTLCFYWFFFLSWRWCDGFDYVGYVRKCMEQKRDTWLKSIIVWHITCQISNHIFCILLILER